MYPRASTPTLWILSFVVLRNFANAAATEPPGYWLGDSARPVPAGVHGGRAIRAKEAAALLKRGAVVVDVSNAPRQPPGLAAEVPWMPVAHRALPGALWLPGVGEGNPLAEEENFYRNRLAQATHGNFDAPLVIYCHERCWLSWNASKRAIALGYRHVYWFAEGVEGWVAAGLPTHTADPQVPSVVALLVLDLELTGDLGGPDMAAEHAARLSMESQRLRDALARTGLFRLVDSAPASETLQNLRSQQAYLHDCNGCDLDVGRQLHADQVLVAWVNRVSGLILTLTYEIHEVKTAQITARKSFDFRGDSDNAWNHAIDYMVRDLRSAATSPPEN
jgi:PQQ-dependent catabolism-associated CXXCW motif protein